MKHIEVHNQQRKEVHIASTIAYSSSNSRKRRFVNSSSSSNRIGMYCNISAYGVHIRTVRIIASNRLLLCITKK